MPDCAYSAKVGQSFDAERLGERQQARYLILEDVHLARVHEGEQRDDRAERCARNHYNGMERRLHRAKQLREECAARAQDDAVGADGPALGRQRHIR